MYSSIQTWVNARITAVNALISGTTNDLVEIDTGFITKENAKAESDKRYQIKVDGWTPEEKEGFRVLKMVDVTVEFAFLITNDDGRTKYGNMITTYLSAFGRELIRPTNTKTAAVGGFTCYGISGFPETSDVNDFEGEFVFPKVTFKLRIGDANS